jgi:hypothetical protein
LPSASNLATIPEIFRSISGETATGIYRQTRDVAIRVGRGRAEYAKPVYGANCVRLTAADVQKWDQILSIGGFVGKTSHALEMCFGSDGDRYTEECFRLSPKEERLYDIRNAINHGDVDAENPNELLRLEARLRRLWLILWRMFGPFVGAPPQYR